MPKSGTDTFRNTCDWEAFVADVGTAFPTASTAVPITGDDAFTSIGYCQDDPSLGIDLETVTIECSNACAPVAVSLVKRTITVDLDQGQFTKLTFEHFWGGGAWATSGSGERFTPASLAPVEKAMIFQLVGADGRKLRLLGPRVGITPNGSLEFPTNDIAKMPVQATVLAPDSGADFYFDSSTALSAA